MANGNVGLYITATAEKLRMIAEELLKFTRDKLAQFPDNDFLKLRQQIAVAEALFAKEKYLEAATETLIAYLMQYGASDEQIESRKNEAAVLAQKVITQVQKELQALEIDEKRILTAVIVDILADYMWGVVDGTLTFNTPLLFIVDEDYMAILVENIKKALTNP